MASPLTTPLTSKSKRVAIGAGKSERNGRYFGRLTSLGAGICNGPVTAGDEMGGTGVAAAAGVGELAAAGAALEVPGADASAHASCPCALMSVRSSAPTSPPMIKRPARYPMLNLISAPL